MLDGRALRSGPKRRNLSFAQQREFLAPRAANFHRKFHGSISVGTEVSLESAIYRGLGIYDVKCSVHVLF